MLSKTPPICDYEGSNYRARFWEGQGRSYEDRVERIALRRLMPPTGTTLIEIGAGFGRLANEYTAYDRVVLFDYSRSLLQEAQAHLGDDPRFIYVAGNWYKMPFVSGLFQTVVQVRTLHHAADVPAILQQLARIAQPNSTYILEFANKHNIKAMLRFWLGRQSWSPFVHEPIEFAELNFNFHPQWLKQQLKLANFMPSRMFTVSRYRLEPLKKLVPIGVLVFSDSLWQWTGNWWQLSPSVFMKNSYQGKDESAPRGAFFACPECLTPLSEEENGRLSCSNPYCQLQWQIEDGIYNFKEPLH
jgi:ubiquinone/menaquinone biosynthesis C-methylase UbiE